MDLIQDRSWSKKGNNIDLGGQAKQKRKEKQITRMSVING